MTQDGTRGWGKIPGELVDRGGLVQMTRAELLVWAILCRHVDGRTWESRPGVATIARTSGLHPRSVQRALRDLAGRGAIGVVDAGGGSGRTARYLLMLPEPRRPDATVARPQTPASRRHGSGNRKPRLPAPKTPASSAGNPGIPAPKPRRLDATRSEGQIEQREQKKKPSRAAAATADEEAELLEIDAALNEIATAESLARRRVGEPVRSQLARELWISPDVVERAVDRAGGGRGSLVIELRQHGRAIAEELAAERAERERMPRARPAREQPDDPGPADDDRQAVAFGAAVRFAPREENELITARWPSPAAFTADEAGPELSGSPGVDVDRLVAAARVAAEVPP